MYAKILGTKLKQLRDEKKLTQEAFGEEVGLTRSAIGMYENGNRLPNIELLCRIADAFDVSVDWLLGRESALRSKQEYPKWLFSLSETELKELENYAKFLHVKKALSANEESASGIV